MITNKRSKISSKVEILLIFSIIISLILSYFIASPIPFLICKIVLPINCLFYIFKSISEKTNQLNFQKYIRKGLRNYVNYKLKN